MVVEALRMAWFRKRPQSVPTFHSDCCSHDASGDVEKQFSAVGVLALMSRKGHGWEKGLTKTLLGSLTVERLRMRFATRRQANMRWSIR